MFVADAAQGLRHRPPAHRAHGWRGARRRDPGRAHRLAPACRRLLPQRGRAADRHRARESARGDVGPSRAGHPDHLTPSCRPVPRPQQAPATGPRSPPSTPSCPATLDTIVAPAERLVTRVIPRRRCLTISAGGRAVLAAHHRTPMEVNPCSGRPADAAATAPVSVPAPPCRSRCGGDVPRRGLFLR